MRVVEVETGGESAIADGRERERENKKKWRKREKEDAPREGKWNENWREEGEGSVVFELKQEDDGEEERTTVRSEKGERKGKKRHSYHERLKSCDRFTSTWLSLSLFLSPAHTFFVQLIPPVTHSRPGAPFLHFSRPLNTTRASPPTRRRLPQDDVEKTGSIKRNERWQSLWYFHELSKRENLSRRRCTMEMEFDRARKKEKKDGV